jgi:hypothetical protein
MPIDVFFALSLGLLCIAIKTAQPNEARTMRIQYAKSAKRAYKR